MTKKTAQTKNQHQLGTSLPAFYLILLLALILAFCFAFVVTKYAKLKLKYERLIESCTQVVVQNSPMVK